MIGRGEMMKGHDMALCRGGWGTKGRATVINVKENDVVRGGRRSYEGGVRGKAW